MSDRDINLDGGEISVIKALGLSGSDMNGADLMKKVPDQEPVELIETLHGLINVGYVECDGGALHDVETFKHYIFRVNPGYAKDLRDALNPQRAEPKSKRVRRE
jgi:hypothetical protein